MSYSTENIKIYLKNSKLFVFFLQITSSPRPTILRKRDHEGSPLKAAKNLTPVLQGTVSNQQHCVQAPASPPFIARPDSRGNGHSSGMLLLEKYGLHYISMGRFSCSLRR